MDRGEITIRPIVAADAGTVADLHTASWRSAYRGIYPDLFLDQVTFFERQSNDGIRGKSPDGASA